MGCSNEEFIVIFFICLETTRRRFSTWTRSSDRSRATHRPDCTGAGVSSTWACGARPWKTSRPPSTSPPKTPPPSTTALVSSESNDKIHAATLAFILITEQKMRLLFQGFFNWWRFFQKWVCYIWSTYANKYLLSASTLLQNFGDSW